VIVFRNIQIDLWRPQRKNGEKGEDCMDKTKQLVFIFKTLVGGANSGSEIVNVERLF